MFTYAKPEHFPNYRETVARIQENGPKDRLEEVPKNFGHLDKLALDYTQYIENKVLPLTWQTASSSLTRPKTLSMSCPLSLHLLAKEST